jgi:hypothetical protein
LKTWPLGINGLVEKTYTDMLTSYGETLEKSSEDVNKSPPERYMTSCKKIVVNIDKFKNDFDHTTDFKVDMGLGRFEKIYFKSVNVYSKTEFETHFVSHYCL